MASKQKFGFFAGVFTPSILTILGVIMYMRLGWVVGNAGLVGTIIIILIAHIIAITTGLSVSSIATDKKIGAGGIYYVLSRSMGVPIGGAIGIALYTGTAFSIALYLIGFAESFNGYFGIGMTVNDFRITGTIALISLTVLALISTSVALKAQFFILTAIIISLIAIFFGTSDFVPQTVQMFSTESSVPLETVFAIFFPAVTGFTAGIAMSGDLKDPKKSIPVGTLLAIGIGLLVYISLAVFISYSVESEILRTDYNILMKISLFAPAVIAGIWGATLSSALGGILGGPRILQAMSIDGVTPKLFGKGKGKDNEPVNALILAFIIAEAGILIGELDVIARVVSMFYLAAYGFINISYYLESWANPDFHPTFKIKRWIGLLGAFASFGVMFKLDMIAMFGAFVLIGGLYFWLQRRQILLQSNDVWQSVWSNIVNKGLQRLDAKNEEKSNWNPNILLFSSISKQRLQLVEFSKIVSGRTGIITDFKLVNKSLSKNKQAYKDELLDRLGIYGRKVEVKDTYTGIENIASTYGFTGVEPNTIMMNWSKTSNSPEKYVKMTEKLIQLDYNLLYLDYDELVGFGKHETIDLWWRDSDSNNAEMMLNVARYISQSKQWDKAKIRILFVNHNNADNTIIRTKISNLIQKFRIDASIKIINNGVDQKKFYDIISLQSSKTDLIVLGIPDMKPKKQATYILNTNALFEVIGSTLLVRASDNFNTVDLNFIQNENLASEEIIPLQKLIISSNKEVANLINTLDSELIQNTMQLADPTFKALSSNYYQFIHEAKEYFETSMQHLQENHSVIRVAREIQVYLNYLIAASEKFKIEKLPEIEKLFELELQKFTNKRLRILQNSPKNIVINNTKVKWQNAIDYYFTSEINPHTEDAFLNLGFYNYYIIKKLTEGINDQAHLFLENTNANEEALQVFDSNVKQIFNEALKECLLLEKKTTNKINRSIRKTCNILANKTTETNFNDFIKRNRKKSDKTNQKETLHNIEAFVSDWSKNQTLIHNQIQADFTLSNAGLSVFIINEMIKSRVYRMTITAQQKDIDLFTEAVNHIAKNINTEVLENYNSRIIHKLSDSVSNIDFDELVRNEENKILRISEKTPKTVQVLTAKSLNNFRNCQNDVDEIEVFLASIESNIIQKSYLSPLQEVLRDLNTIYQQNTVELYNASNLIKTILSESNASNEDHKGNLDKVIASNNECTIKLKKAEETFQYGLGVLIHNTFTDLHIRTILENIETFAGLSKDAIIKSKFHNWYNNQKATLHNQYTAIYDFVSQRKRDVDILKFNEENYRFQNNIEQANLFMNHLNTKKGIEDDLSFYYKKLFTGSHLGKINPTYKAAEINTITNAINRIDEGVNGSLLILGKTSSGKTFFVENIANTMLQGEKIIINPPVKQKFTINDVHIAFQNAFDKVGTSESILNQLSDKTILIFDDLERWWVKSEKGNMAINYIAKLIEKFGSKHYFVLSCNIHSFDVIRKVSPIEKQVLATIIIPNTSKKELQEIILNRHKTGGLQLWHNDKPLENTKNLDQLFSEIHYKSDGNIGVALTTWISSIDKDAAHLFIKNPSTENFPNINNSNWKVVLYILSLHYNLTKAQIDRIFTNSTWVYETLNELEKANLVYRKSATIYALKTPAKFYVEQWLSKLKILK